MKNLLEWEEFKNSNKVNEKTDFSKQIVDFYKNVKGDDKLSDEEAIKKTSDELEVSKDEVKSALEKHLKESEDLNEDSDEQVKITYLDFLQDGLSKKEAIDKAAEEHKVSPEKVAKLVKNIDESVVNESSTDDSENFKIDVKMLKECLKNLDQFPIGTIQKIVDIIVKNKQNLPKSNQDIINNYLKDIV